MKLKLTFALILVVFSMFMVGCELFTTDPDVDDVKCDSHVDLNNDNICDNCTAELEKEIETSNVNVMVNTEKITIKDVDISNFNFIYILLCVLLIIYYAPTYNSTYNLWQKPVQNIQNTQNSTLKT